MAGKPRILITGVAGFIGYHLASALLLSGNSVIGLDNLNDYYDPRLKSARLEEINRLGQDFTFYKADLADADALASLFAGEQPTHVVNLAAQAGVRYSLKNPSSYVKSNLAGFANLLEECRNHEIAHLVFASSSSVYGLNGKQPYATRTAADHPVSLYAASKRANEMMAHSYSYLFGLPCTGLRFFTAYGPWGRPDMALHIFTDAILKGKPVRIFNHGRLLRDFTYIDDIVDGVMRVIGEPAAPDPKFDPERPDPARSSAPWRVYNIGNGLAVPISRFVDTIEEACGREAIREYLPMQPGDVQSTLADVSDFAAEFGPLRHTDLKSGVQAYVDWHRAYYGV